MKVFGSISRLVSILFRKDSQDITVRPNQSTTYTASRDMQLPEGDTAHVLVSRTSADTLTNKTIDGDSNTLQDISIASLKTVLGDADEVILRDASGVVVSAKIVNANVDAAAAIAYSKLSIADGDLTIAKTSGLQSALDGKQANVITTEGDLVVGDASGDPARLAIGTTGQVLTSDGTTAVWAAPGGFDSFAATWATADGTSKVVTHSLGTKDIQVEIYDMTDDQTIFVDSVVRTDANSVTLTASEAPGASSWRVTIHAV